MFSLIPGFLLIFTFPLSFSVFSRVPMQTWITFVIKNVLKQLKNIQVSLLISEKWSSFYWNHCFILVKWKALKTDWGLTFMVMPESLWSVLMKGNTPKEPGAGLTSVRYTLVSSTQLKATLLGSPLCIQPQHHEHKSSPAAHQLCCDYLFLFPPGLFRA